MERPVRPGIFRRGRQTLARIFNPDVPTEVRDELEFHLEMRVREFVASGMDEDAARSRAVGLFGDIEKMKTDLEGIGVQRESQRRRREMWSEGMRDLKYAVRQLRRSPGFAAIAVFTLALGIGANSAVFSVVNGVLLRPLPFAEQERLVNVTSAFPSMGFDRFWISAPEYFELKEWNQAFEDLGAYRTGRRVVETYDQPQEVVRAQATYSLFSTLGVTAARGRVFSSEEDLPGADPVVLLSDGFWRRSFGADPDVLGSTIRVGGVASTVLGVMPAGFDIDDAGVDIWVPTRRDPNDHVLERGGHFLNVVARLSSGVTLERAQADLDRLELRWVEEFTGTHAPSPDGHPLRATSLEVDTFGNVRQSMLLLMGAVCFVLLIACANVANLLLAKAQSRAKEVAVRVALGAGRLRLVRQLLAEGLMLSLLGGGLGLALGQFAVVGLLRINPGGVPRSGGIGLDATVVVYTMGIALLTGVVFGLAPLLNTTLGRVSATLREGNLRTTKSGAGVRARKLLVVAEIALAVVLITGSGLMLRSMAALQEVDLGFDSKDQLTMRLSLNSANYPALTDVTGFYQIFLDRVRGLPGVVSATAVSALPPIRDLDASDVTFEDIPRTEDGPAHNVDYWTSVDADYIETMDIQILEGRGFESQDALSQTPVMMVNQRLVETFYQGQSPLGRRMQLAGPDSPWLTIIGVTADVTWGGIGKEQGTELLLYNPQIAQADLFVYRTMYPVIRVDGNPMALAQQIARIARDLDPTLAVADVQAMEDNIVQTMAQPRFITLLMGVFAAVALVLAAVGTYGVMSYTVAERSREIGIRMAMGAEAGSVRAMVLRQGGALAGTGLVLGVLGAWSLSRLLASQLFQISATDAMAFTVAPVFLAAVAMLACYIPARRATQISPLQALTEG